MGHATHCNVSKLPSLLFDRISQTKVPPSVQKIPSNYPVITPYLVVRNAAQMIDFYKRAFGAKELFRMPAGDKIAHCEMEVRDFIFMLADESQQSLSKAPKPGEPTNVGFMIYVEDVDKEFARAIECGGKVERSVQDQFYGDRSGTFLDPSGHLWTLATHVEDVSPEEMNRRIAKMTNK